MKFIAVLLACVLAAECHQFGTYGGKDLFSDPDTSSPPTVRPTSVSITPSASTPSVSTPSVSTPSVSTPSVSIPSVSKPSVSTAKPVVVPTFPVIIKVSSAPPRPTAVYPSQVTSVPRVPSDDGSAKTIRYENEIINNDGRNYSFETTNGIITQAQLLNYGQPPKTIISGEGYFSWTSPEGKFIEVHYTADQNGYQPTSDAIPKPPPQFARALKYAEEYAARIKN